MRPSFIQALRANRLAMAGLCGVVTLLVLAVLAPLLSPFDPDTPNAYAVLLPPSWQHPLGTDDVGRDLLSRMLYGARVSLQVGLVAAGIATLLGVVLGAVAGYYGGWAEGLIMRFIDLMLCFPTFFLILAVVAMLDPSIINIMVIIGLTSWMGVARMVRAEFLSLKRREFVLAARGLGAGDLRIMLRHMLPNALAPVLVAATLGVAGAILLESGLSFLGLGVQPPAASWGNILSQSKANLEIAWWLSLFPGLAILLTVLCYNLLGEGIRDALDPKLR